MNCNHIWVSRSFSLFAVLVMTFFGTLTEAHAKAKYVGQVFAPSGAPLAGARVKISANGGPVDLYGDKEGLTKRGDPIVTAPDGTYWFYANNGRYRITIEHPRYGLLDEIEEAYLFDPTDPQTVRASSEDAALTLVEKGKLTEGGGNAITFIRQAVSEATRRGPWRMIANKSDVPNQPGRFLLTYNTDWREDANLDQKWLPRDASDACVALDLRPYNMGTCRYLVAPPGPGGSHVEFRAAMESWGPNEGQGSSHTRLAGSLLTVGSGLPNTRYFREVKGAIIPFPLGGALHSESMDEQSPKALRSRLGEVRIPDPEPTRFGQNRYAKSPGERHPMVLVTDGQNGGTGYGATAGRAFVRVAEKEGVAIGDTLV
ncbi:MAG: carboxypeptidase-like regulatory domain-containing protein, partial [Opitutus sp.]